MYQKQLDELNALREKVKQAHDAWATLYDTQQPTVDDANKEYDLHVRAGIVCSLGVGMAMLAPLLGKAAPLYVDAIEEEDAEGKPHDWNKNSAGESTLEGAFKTCQAMRMSEACLVVAGVVANL